jgi:hypothetical protein
LTPTEIRSIIDHFNDRLDAFINANPTSALEYFEFHELGAHLELGLYEWLYLGEVVSVTQERATIVLDRFRGDYARLWDVEGGAVTHANGVPTNDLSPNGVSSNGHEPSLQTPRLSSPPSLSLSRSPSPTHSPYPPSSPINTPFLDSPSLSRSSSTSSNLSGSTLVDFIDLSLSGTTLANSSDGSSSPSLVVRHYNPAPAQFLFASPDELVVMANEEFMAEFMMEEMEDGDGVRGSREGESEVGEREEARVQEDGIRTGNWDGQVWLCGARLFEEAERQECEAREAQGSVERDGA